MNKKNVVSIEDRIPKLKQARKKKANRRLIFYLSIFFFLLAIIVYLQSPLSHIKTISLNGNVFLTDDEALEISGLSTKTNIWTISTGEIEEAFQKKPVVESVKVKRKLPWTVEISIAEYKRVGYIREKDRYYPIIENGTVLTNHAGKTISGDAPLILDFTEEAYLNRMTEELSKLSKGILNMISEVYWAPEEKNKNKIKLYMNDGLIVSSTVRDFAEKMKIYPSIAAQLEPGSKGIVHIGVGAYFEDFNDVQPPKEEDAEEE